MLSLGAVQSESALIKSKLVKSNSKNKNRIIQLITYTLSYQLC